MNSIAKSINAVAYALNRIATALEKTANVQPKAIPSVVKELPTTTTTSTAITETKIKKPEYTYQSSFTSVHITAAEKNALDRICRAITDKGVNPKYHQKIMSDLAKKWPDLSSALTALVAAKAQADRDRINKNSETIWNYKDARKWNR